MAEKLKSSLKEIENEPDRVKEIIKEAYSNPEAKKGIDKAVKKVSSELTGLIDHHATDEQKRQILQH